MKRSTSTHALVEWRVSSALTAAYGRGQDDRTLILSIVFGDGCQVVALETVAKEKVNQGGLDSIFGDHAHQVVGLAPDLYEALALAKRAVKNWRKGAPVSACGCKEIDAVPEVRIPPPPRRLVGNRFVPASGIKVPGPMREGMSCMWYSQGLGKGRSLCYKKPEKTSCFCVAHRREYVRIAEERSTKLRKIAKGLSPNAIMPKASKTVAKKAEGALPCCLWKKRGIGPRRSICLRVREQGGLFCPFHQSVFTKRSTKNKP